MSIKPSTPKGTRDFSSEELSKRNYIKNILQKSFESFAFSPIETPSFERLETLTGVYGEEGDRLVFKILNSGDKVRKADFNSLESNDLSSFAKSISEKGLRYDLTVPLARFVSQHQNNIAFPFKRFQIQNVWRADRPQHGRFQEFTQCDADVVGNKSIIQEIELIKLYDSIFSQLGFNDLVFKINHRGILKGFANHFGANEKLTHFITSIDKLDKIGIDKVIHEIKSQIKEVPVDELKKLLSERDVELDSLKSLFSNNEDSLNAVNDLTEIFNFFSDQIKLNNEIRFDLTLARGLNYYTGTIIEVCSKTNDRLGSIGGGGRYDDLTSLFNLKNISGVGISFGLDRIYLLMDENNMFPTHLDKSFEFMVANFGIENLKKISPYIDKLRNLNNEIFIYPDDVKLNKQFTFANKHNASFVIIYGDNERKKDVVTLKNMQTGDQSTYELSKFVSIIKKL